MEDIIGVIGGAGVAAANKLNDIIEHNFTMNGAYRDSHHPQIVTFQAVKIPSRSMFLEGRGESFIPGYIDIGVRLKSIGASRLCMCCNTAHFAIREIESKVGVPFFDMIEEVVKTVSNGNYMNVGIMASDGCRLGKVYDAYFQQFYPKSRIIYPNDKFQGEVTRGIVNIKNRNRFLPDGHTDRPRTIFNHVCEHLYNSGADVIVSGCTDIAVDFMPVNYSRLPVIDSLSALASRIISYWKESTIEKIF